MWWSNKQYQTNLLKYKELLEKTNNYQELNNNKNLTCNN